MLWKAANLARPLSVRCDGGLVWVTEENDSRDVVLGPEQEFVAESAGLVVVQALTDATFTAAGRGVVQKKINPNCRFFASYKGMNGGSRRRQEDERSIMKTSTIAVMVSIGLALATVSSSAAPQSPQSNVVSTARATAPYFAQDVERSSAWVGVGLSMLLVAYFVAELIASYKHRAPWTGKPLSRKTPAVSKMNGRRQTLAPRPRLVWDGAGQGTHGAN